MIVVIPSCRSINNQYLESLIDYGVRFIIIDDTEGTIRIDHPQFEVYNWGDRFRLLGEDEFCIPKGNGACRNLGFYIAWKESDPEEIVVALDDDCIPETLDFPQKIQSVLGRRSRKIAQGLDRHLNTFDLYDGIDSTSCFPRGFPYSSRLSYIPCNFDHDSSEKIVFNLGLWRGVFDINAIDRIKMENNYHESVRLRFDNVLVPRGAYISVCSGNMHFYKEVIPAIYQLPMNIEIMNGCKINRFGDIWAGYILKRLIDIKGDYLGFGEPIVLHSREGSFVNNAASEHLACLINEEFIDYLLRATDGIKPESYFNMMTHLREEFEKYAETTSPVLRKYLSVFNRSLRSWLKILN